MGLRRMHGPLRTPTNHLLEKIRALGAEKRAISAPSFAGQLGAALWLVIPNASPHSLSTYSGSGYANNSGSAITMAVLWSSAS